MATITRWDPFADVVNLRDVMDRLMSEAVVRPARFITDRADGPQEFGMPVDVAENDDALTVKAALPGVKPEDLDINVTGDVLTIKGETKAEADTTEGNYHRKEIRYGRYVRSFTLPVAVQSDKAEATFENGVLTLMLPKMEAIKPKQIKVQPKVVLDTPSPN